MKRKIYIFCIFSIVFLLNTNVSYCQPQYTIEKLPFCKTEYDEFSPAYFNDGIVFCADWKNDVFISYSDTSDEAKKLLDLYFVNLKENGKWRTPELIPGGLNTIFNEGPASFFNSNHSVAFTRNIYSVKKFGNYNKPGNYNGIFFAEYYNDKWTNITPFEYNSGEYNVMHPTVSEDGKIMYFASDMPGGYGGFDIYVSHFKNNKWTKPENLGPDINSDQNEAFPFIHSSGRLFFASKGWNSKGGFDIFYSQQIEDKWIHPQIMKEPINSVYDDFGLIADEYLQTGYFSSSRNKSDDIYAFKSVITEFENCSQQKKNTFCYVFYENGTSEGDVSGSMRYEWDFGDGTKVRGLEVEHCYAKTGKYLVKLNVIDSLTGEVYFNQAHYDHIVEEREQPFITAPDFAVEGETIKLDAKKCNMKNFRIAKYYWDFGDGNKGIGDEVSHVFYQEGVYDVKLQIESTQGKTGVRKSCVYRSVAVKKP
jgi:PKD domain/WD40-like Beta Propeller Repeat